MQPILAARGRGAGELIQKLLEGDPVAIIILVASVVITALIVWLAFSLEKWRGQKLAAAMGGCEYSFSPDGLFGKRRFVISGAEGNVRFRLTAKRISKGVYRTYLEIEKSIPGIHCRAKSTLPRSSSNESLAITTANFRPGSILPVFG
jgi:hypothetical protein